jgi:hypothetical protein
LKRFHFFTRIIKFFYDLLTYEDVRLLLRRDRRTLFNINRLKKEKTGKLSPKQIRKRIKYYSNSVNKNVLSFKTFKRKKGKKTG